MNWVTLNADGAWYWGDLFLDNRVPVKSMEPQVGWLGQAIETFYLVDWEALTEVQRTEIVHRLCNKFDAEKEEMELQVKEKGMPLRKSLTRDLLLSDGVRLFI